MGWHRLCLVYEGRGQGRVGRATNEHADFCSIVEQELRWSCDVLSRLHIRTYSLTTVKHYTKASLDARLIQQLPARPSGAEASAGGVGHRRRPNVILETKSSIARGYGQSAQSQTWLWGITGFRQCPA